MPPTVQTTSEREKQLSVRTAERRSELVCRVKYCNTLPDIPFDPKFITYPFESTRFIQYNPTSLERNYKYEVLTEHDLGVTIDLINRDTYATDYTAVLDPADEKLLEEDILTPQDSKRSRHHARSVSWLRRTEYISTEQTRFQPQTMDKVEAKVGYSIKKNLRDETLIMDRDSQIKAIDKTFDDSKLQIDRHYSKPGVVPVEILPVYPDFKLWRYPSAQVIFDSDPAPTGRSLPAQIEEMSQAMIRGVKDESGEQFVAYFLPTETTLEKRKNDFANSIDYEDDEVYEYKMAREYNWNVKSKSSKGYEENYFFVVRPDGVYYNELETRVRLSKRRQKAGTQPVSTLLVVRHRPMNAQEHYTQRYRERQLEPPGEEEEEEEEEMEQQEEAKNEEDGGFKSASDNEKESDNEKDEDEEKKKETQPVEKRKSGSEAGSNDERASKGTRSRSSSAESRQSRSRSRSPKSKSRSRSPQKTRSQSGSPAKSRSRSHSGSPAKSRSRSHSGSPAKSRSRSHSGSPTKSRSRSRSGSPAKSRSRSGSRAQSGSESPRSGSVSPARTHSRSGSPAKSGSESPQQNQSPPRSPRSSPAKSGSESPEQGRSRTASPAKSASRSPDNARSGSGSPGSPNSGSGSPASKSGSGSGRSNSPSHSEESGSE